MRCKDWSFTDQQFTDSHERSTNRYVRRHDLNLDLILLQLQKQLLSKFETLVLWRVHEMDWTQKLRSGWLLESKIRGYKRRDTMPYAAAISHDFHKWRDPTLYQSCTPLYAIPIIEEVQMFDYIQKNDVRKNSIATQGPGVIPESELLKGDFLSAVPWSNPDPDPT